jgi:hypothetical protein
VERLNQGDDQQQEEGDDCGGGLMERCGVRLSVVVTGPISNDDDANNNNDATSDVEGPNCNNNEDNDKWNYWTGRKNNVTNLYIEFKRISPPRPQQYERYESNNDSSNGNLQRGRGNKSKRQHHQQRKATDMIYNEENQSFSC